MKRILTLVMIFGALLMFTSSASALDTVGKMGIGINGGLAIPAGGDVDVDASFGDYFDVGPAFGLHVRYGVMKELTLEAGFRYAFMKMKEDVNEDLPDEPNVVMPEIYLDGIFNIGSFFNDPNNIFNPYVRAGVGIVPWKVTDDGPGGDVAVMENNEEFKKTSFSFNVGAGLEIFATSNIAVFAEGRYLMVFTEDEDTFGDEFGNLGNVNINAGVTYYFPLSSR